MHRAALLLLSQLAVGVLFAQQAPIVTIRVFADPMGARFRVDGQEYTGPATFFWSEGSKHILEAIPIQVDVNGSTRYTFTGWEESTGKLSPGTEVSQTVTAHRTVTFFKANYGVAAHKVYLSFHDSGAVSETGEAAVCGAPGSPNSGRLRVGVVYVNGQCYRDSTVVWLSGPVTLNAFPYPGFVFKEWWAYGQAIGPYLTTVDITGPTTLTAHFQPAKRVNFRTSPPGLKVLIDRTLTPTPDTNHCTIFQTLPPGAPAGVAPLCWGEFDWGMNSTHLLAVPEHQVDLTGNDWVFEAWSHGGGQNTPYTVTSLQPAETFTAKFVRGAKVGLSTSPAGLKLAVDGSDHWTTHNFVWGVGSKHQVSAPADQVDSRGRRYKFVKWSNGADASQEITVDESWVSNSPRLTAHYELLGRLTLESSPSGLPLMVDGEECRTPCKIDRAAGTEIRVAAPTTEAGVYENSRFRFVDWSDSSVSERLLAVPLDERRITARYQLQYLLSVSSDPSDSVLWRMQPSSTNSYFDADSEVAVRVEAKPGFKFLGWGGDLQGPSTSGSLKMVAPQSIRAFLKRVPFLHASGVRNAATATVAAVTPGSIISIFGVNLSSATEVGPSNPLSQTLAGVTVQVGSHLLPLFFVSPAQINAQLPYELAEGKHILTVRSEGQPEVSTEFTAVRNAPGLFHSRVEDRSLGTFLRQEGQLVEIDRPAKAGDVLTFFATGLGPYERKPPTGFVLPEGSSFKLADRVEIVIGEASYLPEYAGPSVMGAGMNAVRFRLMPEMTNTPVVTLKVRVNGQESNPVLLPVESALQSNGVEH